MEGWMEMGYVSLAYGVCGLSSSALLCNATLRLPSRPT
jgi:hypothetical protein